MRVVLRLAAASAASLGLASAALAGPSVMIKDAVARVRVIPEARADVKVEVAAPNGKLPLKVTTANGETVIDGGLSMDVNGDRAGCDKDGDRPAALVRGVGEVAWADMPELVIHVPLDAKVGASGAVFGQVGLSQSLVLNNGGCGDWTVADVKGKFALSQAGSGSTTTGALGAAEAHIAGSGGLNTQAIAGDLEVYLAGSAEVTAASAGGDIAAYVAGPGQVILRGGHAHAVKVGILSSGGVTFGGVADSAEVSIVGSGDVHLAKVTGTTTKSITGTGEVILGPIER